MKRRKWAVLLLIILMAACMPGFSEETDKGCSHQWKQESRTEPTCTGKGKAIYRCSLCGKKKTENLPALGHDWSYCTMLRAPTCTRAGVTRCYCSRNAEHYKDTTQDALGHDWSAWETELEPWLTRAGREKRKCGRCGETETKRIPPLIQRKEYELSLTVFAGESARQGIRAGLIRKSGEAGFPVEWICAAANTGKKDLRIRTDPGDPAEEPILLPAGEVTLISVYTAIREADLPRDAETIEIGIRLRGETEEGEPACETGPVSGTVRIFPDDSPDGQDAPGLEIRQELIPGTDAQTGYAMGTSVRCSVTIANRGDKPLSGIVIRSFDRAEAKIPESLAPGESRTVTMEHTVIRQDAIAGYICWTSTAEAEQANGSGRISAQSGPLIVPVRAE